MSITCTVCGTVNPDGTTYCEGCGVELSPQQAAAPAPASPTDPTPALVDGDLTPPDAPVPHSPAVQTPDTPELAAGVPDMPMTESPDATPASTADAAAPGAALPETGAAETTATSPDVTEPAPVAAAAPAPTAPTAAPSDMPAKLGIKKYGAPTGEFIPLHGERLVVGRFDASSGPVDIDLTGMGGQEHISRRHAELYRENGVWTVRDLGSTNGVYVKRAGESAFSPRLQEPAPLHDGDELAFGNLMLTFHQG
ncbi:hypothetical protein HNQ07_004764 [Deinococcus metalli]|uniref:FraH-like protein n=1 Tax=Deinococcus metalli TaxID=1141878 RepID=A0A7W8NQN1_9DEIO|nr:FHA domain-containing protein [Deinococcus metalli]MBB5379249.1 hypothetical protein [Deinococcus metalli]GHF65717.1 FraH-like protein [Deinococcus metalli]